MSFATQNDLAKHFASLHQPGNPVVLGNVYDILSTFTLLTAKPKAFASASFAIANTLGIQDPDLTMDQNLEACQRIAKVIPKSQANPKVLAFPFTLDIQDGYGDRLEECIRRAIELGAVGVNLEDTYDAPTGEKHVLRPAEEQAERLKLVRKVATEAGVPDFFINARVDAIYIKGDAGVEELYQRAKLYHDTGVVNCLFLWGGPMRGITSAEVERGTKEFPSISVMARPSGVNGEGGIGGLTVKEMGALNVSRISTGPFLMKRAMDSYRDAALTLFGGGPLEVRAIGK